MFGVERKLSAFINNTNVHGFYTHVQDCNFSMHKNIVHANISQLLEKLYDLLIFAGSYITKLECTLNNPESCNNILLFKADPEKKAYHPFYQDFV